MVLAATAAQAAEFTPAQRAEIVAIVRDALKQDPSILRDAVIALQADEGERSQAAARAAIGHVQGELVLPDRSGGRRPAWRRDDRRVLRHTLSRTAGRWSR